MSKLHFTTKHANEATVQRNWYVVDGTNQTVGRMCARIAAILRGRNLIKRRPEVVIERAVKGMLPKNRLGRKMYKKLFVYVGDKHPHTAQAPKELNFNYKTSK